MGLLIVNGNCFMASARRIPASNNLGHNINVCASVGQFGQQLKLNKCRPCLVRSPLAHRPSEEVAPPVLSSPADYSARGASPTDTRGGKTFIWFEPRGSNHPCFVRWPLPADERKRALRHWRALKSVADGEAKKRRSERQKLNENEPNGNDAK